MTKKISVIDYDMCNLLNVVRAFEYIGANVTVIEHPGDVKSADRLVVPGVGAFRDCMEEMTKRGFADSIKDFAETERPMLGICVGMQALFEGSEEFGETTGLGLIEGWVRRIPSLTAEKMPQRVPHIGWNHLCKPNESTDWDGTLLDSVAEHSAMYFVHSYAAVPEREDNRLADVLYGGHRVASAVRRGNVYGCQFHPERSGPMGLKVLQRFSDM